MTGSTPSTSKTEYYSEYGVPWVTPTDINAQTISDTPRKLSEEGVKVARVVPANTILCTCIASIGKNTLLTVKGSFNQQINSLTPNNKNNPYFLLTESKKWSDKMKMMAASGTMQIVNKTEFSELLTMVPELSEQKIVGEFFYRIDELITLHQWKCKFYLKINCIVWEQRKLGELGTLKNGMNFSKDAMGHGYDFINLQNIFGKSVIDIQNLELAEASKKQLIDYSLKKGDVLFVRSSVKLEGVGEAALVPETLENTTYSGFIIRFRDEYGLNNDFKKIVFTTKKVRDQIMSQATNSANKNISQKVLENLSIEVPSYNEQEKIGEYFNRLDNLITLHRWK